MNVVCWTRLALIWLRWKIFVFKWRRLTENTSPESLTVSTVSGFARPVDIYRVRVSFPIHFTSVGADKSLISSLDCSILSDGCHWSSFLILLMAEVYIYLFIFPAPTVELIKICAKPSHISDILVLMRFSSTMRVVWTFHHYSWSVQLLHINSN